MTANINNESVFRAAIPYAIGSVGLGVSGIAIAAVAVTTIAKVVGIAMAIIGTFGGFGTLLCGLNSENAQEFRANWGKTTTITIFTGTLHFMTEVISNLIFKLIFGERSRVNI